MLKRLTAVALLLTVMACGKDGPTQPAISAAGAWTGSLSIQGDVYQFSATLTDNAGTISGSGMVQGGGSNRAATNAGTRSGPSISMSWSSPGVTPVNYTATLSADNTKMTGTLNGSGFNGEALVLNKN